MNKKTTSKENPGKRVPAGKKPKAVTMGARLRVASRQPIQVKHLAQLPKYVRPKRIHPRRTLPLVREGLEREFHSMTRQVTFHRALPALMPTAATDELLLVTNTELTSPKTQQRASNVGEPSVAINDHVVFCTGNWYAAMSSDGGKTWVMGQVKGQQLRQQAFEDIRSFERQLTGDTATPSRRCCTAP